MVGGGGQQSDLCGGGSGYLNYTVQPLENLSYKISVAAGGERQSSTISINGITITASPGQDAYSVPNFQFSHYYGGNGYSGGGGYCNHYDLAQCSGNLNGGSNGSNGEGPSTPVNDQIMNLGAYGHGPRDR